MPGWQDRNRQEDSSVYSLQSVKAHPMDCDEEADGVPAFLAVEGFYGRVDQELKPATPTAPKVKPGKEGDQVGGDTVLADLLSEAPDRETVPSDDAGRLRRDRSHPGLLRSGPVYAGLRHDLSDHGAGDVHEAER